MLLRRPPADVADISTNRGGGQTYRFRYEPGPAEPPLTYTATLRLPSGGKPARLHVRVDQLVLAIL
jgi:hypothetical protein